MIKFIVTAVSVFFLQACATADKSVVDPIAMYKKGMEEGNKAMVEEVQRNLKQKNAYGSRRALLSAQASSRYSQGVDRGSPERSWRSDSGPLGFHGGHPWAMGIAFDPCLFTRRAARERPTRSRLSKISPLLLRPAPRAR